jgi:8-oxo-dGTP diphosphatase
LQRVNTAVAVVVTADERVLFGRRRVAGGGYAWQLPGGWIEVGESPQQAGRREVSEETGLSLGEMHFICFTNNVFSAHKHSISLYFQAECVDRGALVASENEKCYGWEWKRWADVNDNLFLPLRLLKQTDYRPFYTRDPGT